MSLNEEIDLVASGAAGAGLTYSWHAGRGKADNIDSPSTSYTAPSETGDDTVIVQVKNGCGSSGSARHMMEIVDTISENRTPTISPSPTPTDTSVPSATPTSTFTPTNTPTATPSSLPKPYPEIRLTASVYLRKGPGPNYPQLDTIPEGEVVQVLAIDTYNLWYNIVWQKNENTEIMGWIYINLSQPVSETDALAITQVPTAVTIPSSPIPTLTPTPTPTPTPVPGNGGGGDTIDTPDPEPTHPIVPIPGDSVQHALPKN